jgi:hypothetical protein
MRVQAAYEIAYPDGVELFSESETGAFDFDSAFDANDGREATAKRSRELLGGERTAAELFFPDEAFSRPAYEAPALRSGGRRLFRRAAERAKPISASVSGFLLRYPGLRSAFRAGAYAEAGRIVDRSRKLAAFASLLRWRFSDDAFLAFALYWMNEFDGGKDAALSRLLTGDAPEPPPRYAAAFEFARESIKSRDIPSFKAEVAGALRERILGRRMPIVLPVVGAGFRPTLGKLSALLGDAAAEARRRALVEGLVGAEARIAAYAGDLEVKVVPEPYNAYDPNAVAVLIRSDEGPLERAGYLKREVAAALSPLVAEGATFSGRFARIYEGGQADVEVRVG